MKIIIPGNDFEEKSNSILMIFFFSIILGIVFSLLTFGLLFIGFIQIMNGIFNAPKTITQNETLRNICAICK